MKRQHQLVLVASTLAFSWLAMQAVHEMGHIVAAFLSGGRVSRVILHPATISQTQLQSNPHPLLVVWMGPIVGVVLPTVLAAAARIVQAPGWYVLQFFAGFCLVANGAYIGFGSFAAIGDAGDALRHGSPIWLLWLFGLTTLPIGFYLWYGLGPHFGLVTGQKPVNARIAYTLLGLTLTIVLLELTLSSIE
jgi:hypothetical protein